MTRELQPAVYIVTNRHMGALYVGVTFDLIRRVWLHRTDSVEGFTRRHGLHRLVFFEMHESMLVAIEREKQLKHWNRAWKIRLIEEGNPGWRDLWRSITGG